jgi:predicted acetyltransferase
VGLLGYVAACSAGYRGADMRILVGVGTGGDVRLPTMTIEIRQPTDDEFGPLCRVDGRAFGFAYTDEDVEKQRPWHDMSRFRIAVDAGRIVSVAGSYAKEMTMPGGSTVPMGGVTWVSTAATHRRQGLARRVIDAVHADIDDRGEPLAALTASEGGIYENFGYGVASTTRVTSIDTRQACLRREFELASTGVRYLEDDEAAATITKIWDRYRRTRAGELQVETAERQFFIDLESKPVEGMSAALYLAHPDGFASYRVTMNWNDGHPAHAMRVTQLAAVTPEAHVALWQTLLRVDLVGSITTRQLPIDDPLPYLLDNPRVVRTTGLNDGLWLNARDIPTCFGTRTYRTEDRLVVEADGRRWQIEGGPDGAVCKSVRTKPDMVTSHGWLSALLLGGVQPSSLVAGRRMTARNDDVLRRADLFFPTSLAPHCQTHF